MQSGKPRDRYGFMNLMFDQSQENQANSWSHIQSKATQVSVVMTRV
jgi:hypothetical protein